MSVELIVFGLICILALVVFPILNWLFPGALE
jgi:hypothetical protein